MLNFHHRFLKKIAALQVLLYELCKSSKKNDQTKMNWSDELKQKFFEFREAIANVVLLAYFNPHAKISLLVDASDLGIGSVLQKTFNGISEPLAFFLEN